MLRAVYVSLDHLLDGARGVAEMTILGQVNRAHAATADSAHDFITTV
jgi:hypothetical protein